MHQHSDDGGERRCRPTDIGGAGDDIGACRHEADRERYEASLNGVVNCSILDGWWPEAYNGKNGWAIGEEREYSNYDEQDWNDSQHLYQLLENEIVPRYYDRPDGIPHRWLEVAKEAIITVAPFFSTRRMVKEYTEKLYLPAAGVNV